MKKFDDILSRIGDRMRELDSIRERALSQSREIILNCRKCIQSIHNGDFERARKHLTSAGRRLKTLYKMLDGYPEIKSAGFVENASQEFVEAKCLYNLERKGELPDPDKLGVPYVAFLLGLCDLIGELRRFSLDSMRHGNIDDANRYLEMMEEIYESIMDFEYPSSLKRKQDIARGLIEKTKSELAVASCEKRINDRIEEFRGLLDIVEKNKLEEKKKREKPDLDIDRVW